jgi:Protein of unknown function (DUF3293)
MNPKDFRQAYLDTVYRAASLAFQFSMEPTDFNLFDGLTFCVMTAANPRSEQFSDADNDARNLEMRAVIEAKGWKLEPSEGVSPTGDWREPGFLIWDAPLEDVLQIGRDFGQNAIVYGTGKRIALAWCDDGELEWFTAKPFRLQDSKLSS